MDIGVHFLRNPSLKFCNHKRESLGGHTLISAHELEKKTLVSQALQSLQQIREISRNWASAGACLYLYP